jgi:dihydrofolate reductase
MRLVIHEFLTLDGVIQGPGGPDEDTSGGFTRGGWGVPFFDDEVGAVVDSWFASTAEVLFGRTTYRMMADYWPLVTDPDDRVATVLNSAPKHVVSPSLETLDWAGAALLAGDPLDAVAELKARPGGELQVHGSAMLATALLRAGLVDELRLLTFPVTVGGGKRLFPPDAPASGFRSLEARAFRNGSTYVALEPVPFAVGEFVVDDGGVERAEVR